MRHTQWFVTLVLLSLLTATASNQCAAGQSNEQIFVSSDSPPGWKPTEAQKELASKTLAAFFTALDHDAYADAYNLHSDLLKRQMSSQQFEDISKKFRFAAGMVLMRRVNRSTWTNSADSGRVPIPGVYVAIDHDANFSNADRYCGYVILFQTTPDGAFTVMRHEENFIPNDVAQKINVTKSQAELNRLWKQMSAHCPNLPQEDRGGRQSK